MSRRPIEISDEEYHALLADMMTEPGPARADEIAKRWEPALTPKQLEVFYDTTPNLLVPGNRFSGKGYSVGYAACKHAYDWPNALVLVVVKTKRQGSTGGFFSKLTSEILPDFERNITGFSFKGPYTTIEKDLVVAVSNRFGGTSLIQMISIHHDNDLNRKVKGIEATQVVVDEITLFETEEVFSQLSATLGRRSSVPPEHQRFIGTCNPDSPEHWVYQKWFVEPADDPEMTRQFKVLTIHKEDNPAPQVDAYYKRLAASLKNKPIQYRRDVLGEWVAVPKGDGLFSKHFVKDFHVRGDAANGDLLLPKPKLPIVVGLDLGDVNHGVVFLQERYTRDKVVWILFDEIVLIKKRVSLDVITEEMMRKMQHWCRECDHSFDFKFVSDKSAFDRFRAATGSYDHMEVEKHSKRLLPKFPMLRKPIRMLECPKPSGSVGVRTRIVQDLLTNESLFVSASCKSAIEMLESITGTEDDPFAPDTHDKNKHVLDALTYPLFYYGAGVTPAESQEETQSDARVIVVP